MIAKLKLRQLIAAGLVFLVLCTTTILAWNWLRLTSMEQVRRIFQAEALSDREELTQNLNLIYEALSDVRDFWDRFGGLPQEQWRQDAGIELQHFKGLEGILWYTDGGERRFLRSRNHTGLDYRPSDAELAAFEDYLKTLGSLNEDAVLGPYKRGGDFLLQVYLLSEDPERDGGLVAIVNLGQTISQILADSSPAYSLAVSNDDRVVFEARETATSADGRWQIEGPVPSKFALDLNMSHAPTSSTTKQLSTPAINAILWLGLIIAVLVALLVYEYAGALGRMKRAESKNRDLKEAKKELELIVAERTRELQQRNADLHTLNDSVAHDMRNPLNAVSMTAQLIAFRLQDGDHEEEIELIQRLQPSIRQMSDILDRLVGLSTLSNTTFNREPIDIRALAREVFDGLIAAEPPPPVDFTLEPIPETDGDPVLIKALLMNLLGNALKYTREKKKRKIRFGVFVEKEEKVYYVKDNGKGFDADSSQDIFKAFERLETGEEMEGMGLGLTICMRVVQRHGGRIWARGEAGEGARFFFTLGAKSGQPPTGQEPPRVMGEDAVVSD